MAVRQIVTIGDDVLRKKAKPVQVFDDKLKAVVADMFDTLYASGNGIGLAAPQVGLLKRIFVIDLGDGDAPRAYINPEWLEQKGEQFFEEGCLSVPNEHALVARPAYVKIRAQDVDGTFFEEEATGLRAVCMCHETDHLDGILFPDRAKALQERQS